MRTYNIMSVSIVEEDQQRKYDVASHDPPVALSVIGQEEHCQHELDIDDQIQLHQTLAPGEILVSF